MTTGRHTYLDVAARLEGGENEHEGHAQDNDVDQLLAVRTHLEACVG